MKTILETINESAKDYPKNIIGLCEKIVNILQDNDLNVELDWDDKHRACFYVYDPKSKSKDTLVLDIGISPKRR